MKSQPIELLAPAANLTVGRAAIDAGADAVYIGGPAFGARVAAANSIEDVEALCRYAHLFGVKIYLTLNTLIHSSERGLAAQIIWQAYHAGVDAIIVQDMSLLDMALPPIALHASTQCYNATVAQVLAFEQSGFEQVVLERALTIDQIREIRRSTSVKLEIFIHGAICVGYSGRCNLSEYLTHRSGNRGECSQPCRANYDLLDSTGRVLAKNEALLSPRDLNLSNRLHEIVQAGVNSLKIEGRLKDAPYVINVVSHYNRILTEMGVQRTSQGRATALFQPNPALTFNRGFTEWFFDGQSADVLETKGKNGEFIGIVSHTGDKWFEVDSDLKLSNGDGITFAGGGVRVNRVDGTRIFPLNMTGITTGTAIYRNFSITFEPKATRTIDLDITLTTNELRAADDYGIVSIVPLPLNYQIANNPEKTRQTIVTALSKSADTIFTVRNVAIECDPLPFFPISTLNALRRNLLAKMAVNRVHREEFKISKPTLPDVDSTSLMQSSHCVLRSLGMCLKNNPNIVLPLYLINNKNKLLLNFHCSTCGSSHPGRFGNTGRSGDTELSALT